MGSTAQGRPPESRARLLFDRYALAGNDDYEGHYSAALGVEILSDGDYWLAVGVVDPPKPLSTWILARTISSTQSEAVGDTRLIGVEPFR
ncbi:hypothetical protein [Thiocapsa marina]|uniref:Uncharacterized protein n=1 Tax=Thiocapsa marina 5811 TaxID=768671 RepID=F9U6W9_9GAMM|nr:hypothetical protein [Thiocapsa marina]EGV19995.1 hypothetical protein ThimaDRAFT_0671 [Thiocapsa marina 5811]